MPSFVCFVYFQLGFFFLGISLNQVMPQIFALFCSLRLRCFVIEQKKKRKEKKTINLLPSRNYGSKRIGAKSTIYSAPITRQIVDVNP